MLKVKAFNFNPFQENTYVVSRESGETIIVDPGCFFPEEERELVDYIESNELKPTAIYNTHCHIDHVLGGAFVKEKFEIPFYCHEKDLEWLRAVKIYASNYGFDNYREFSHNGTYDENDTLFEGDEELEVLFLPGHAPGHTALVNHPQKIALVGDVIFDGSIGRTDLPGGDHETLIRSIKEELFKLPDDYTLFTGHGPETTIGKERVSNPFVGENS